MKELEYEGSTEGVSPWSGCSHNGVFDTFPANSMEFESTEIDCESIFFLMNRILTCLV